MKTSALKLVSVLALLGLADAGYLTYVHYTKIGVVCSLVTGCDRVLASDYAVLLGVPAALLGLLYYALLILLTLFYLVRPDRRLLWTMAIIVSLGVIVSLWFLYLQIFVIKSYCEYCLLSASLTLGIFFIIAFYGLRRSERVPEILL